MKLFFYFLMWLGLAGCAVKETREIVTARDGTTALPHPADNKAGEFRAQPRRTEESGRSDAAPDSGFTPDAVPRKFDGSAATPNPADAQSHIEGDASETRRLFGKDKEDARMRPPENLDAGAAQAPAHKETEDAQVVRAPDAAAQLATANPEPPHEVIANLDASIPETRLPEFADAMASVLPSAAGTDASTDLGVTLDALPTVPDATDEEEDAPLEAAGAHVDAGDAPVPWDAEPSIPPPSESDAQAAVMPDTQLPPPSASDERVFATDAHGQLARFNGEGSFVAAQKPAWSRQAVAWTLLEQEEESYLMLVYPRQPGESVERWMQRAEVGDSFPAAEQTRSANEQPARMYETNDLGLLPDRHAFIFSERFVYYLKWQDGLPEESDEAVRAMQESGWWVDPFPEEFRGLINSLEVE